MAQYFLDFVYSLTTCISCFPSSPNLTINQRSFKILRLLGEGGFSYVYLVQDNTGQLYALKKIRCKSPPIRWPSSLSLSSEGRISGLVEPG